MVRSKFSGVGNSNLSGSVRTCCFNLRFWIHPVFWVFCILWYPSLKKPLRGPAYVYQLRHGNKDWTFFDTPKGLMFFGFVCSSE